MLNKIRLDKILVSRGIAENSNKARALIMSGKIIVNGKKIEKSGTKFLDDIEIRVLTKKHHLEFFILYPKRKITKPVYTHINN